MNFLVQKRRKEVTDVLQTGIMMRYGFDGPRKGIWKANELEKAFAKDLVVHMRNWFPVARLH